MVAPESDCGFKTSAHGESSTRSLGKGPSSVQDRRPENGSYPNANKQFARSSPPLLCLPSLAPLYGTLLPHDQPPTPLFPPLFPERISRLSLGVDPNRDQEAKKKDARLGTFSTLNFTATPRPFFFSRCNLFRFARIQLLLPFLPSPHPSRALPCPCSAPLGPDKTTSVDDTVQ